MPPCPPTMLGSRWLANMPPPGCFRAVHSHALPYAHSVGNRIVCDPALNHCPATLNPVIVVLMRVSRTRTCAGDKEHARKRT